MNDKIIEHKRNNKKTNNGQVEKLIKQNNTLTKKIKRLERENKTLKSQNKTLEDAWEKTEEYLKIVTGDQDLDEIFSGIKEKTDLTKSTMTCPNCNNQHLNTRQNDGYQVITCSKCGYKNRK